MGIPVLLLLLGALFLVRNYLKEHETTEISGIVSEEKGGLFENQKVKDILALKYGLKVRLTSPHGDTFNREDISFIWHGGEYYKTWVVEKEKLSLLKEESLFATFLVFYTWKGNAERLERQGLLQREKKGPLYIDLKKTGKLIFSRRSAPRFIMADPSVMTSGLEFMSILVRFFSGYSGLGNPPGSILEKTRLVTHSQGYAFKGEARIFDLFIRTAERRDTLLVGYEQQVLECYKNQKLLRPVLKKKLRVLYPKIPVWIVHPFLVLKKDGSKLVEALKDKNIQNIAREEYGWRRAVMGKKNRMKEVKALSIPVLLPRPYIHPETEMMALLKEELSSQ